MFFLQLAVGPFHFQRRFNWLVLWADEMWKKLHRNLLELSKPEQDLLQRTFTRIDVDGDGCACAKACEAYQS